MNDAPPWEAHLLDWTPLALNGEAVPPRHVLDLLSAGSDTEASRAYWVLDGNVCMNGVLSGAAVPVTQMLLAMVPRWTDPARSYCLELLAQICASEPTADAPEARRQCLAEMRQAAWYFFHGLQFDRVENVPLYVDVLCLLGLEFDELRPRSKLYLSHATSRGVTRPVEDLIGNTLAELEAAGVTS